MGIYNADGARKDFIMEATITINKGYKPHIKSSIDETDAFWHQYKMAAEILDSILEQYGTNAGYKNNPFEAVEYPNNVIAFCGERGDGKTSMLLSFMNLLKKYKKTKIENSQLFFGRNNIDSTYFMEEIYVDPSALDGVHNILDLLVATMFKNFKQSLENSKIPDNIDKQHKLLKSFQKVYRLLSIVKNSERILEDEFDYDGNIDKLSSLSDSMQLKKEMECLVQDYISYMNDECSNVVIPVMIDDLDMSFSYAYAMAEQIRKYMIIPGIVVILSVRLQQLINCIKEYNIKQLNGQVKISLRGVIRQEIEQASENYVSKLIPLAHRISIPKVQELYGLKLFFDNEHEEVASSPAIFALHKLYEKTGMIFILDHAHKHSILPHNLRDMVNFIGFLDLLPNVTGSAEDMDWIKHQNICQVIDYYSEGHLSRVSNSNHNEHELIDQLKCFLSLWKNTHYVTSDFLRNLYVKFESNSRLNNAIFYNTINAYIQQSIPYENSFCLVMNSIRYMERNCFNMREFYYINMLKLFYTLTLSKIMTNSQDAGKITISDFTQNTIWGYDVCNIIPAANFPNLSGNFPRGRFHIRFIDAFNIIADALGVLSDYRLKAGQGYVSKVTIESSEDRKKYILAWVMLGLLSNAYYYQNGNAYESIDACSSLVFDNSRIPDYIHVSIENLLVKFSNMRGVKELLNIDLLGLDIDEVNEIINGIEESNEVSVNISKLLICNVDLIQNLLNRPMIQYRKKADELERTEKLIENFLKHINDYMDSLAKEYGYDIPVAEDSFIIFRYGSEQEEKINIPHLYAKLCDRAAKPDNFVNMNNANVQSALEEFTAYLEGRNIDPPYNINRYIKYTTAQSRIKTLKENLLLLAHALGTYMIVFDNYLYVDYQTKMDLCALYKSVCEAYELNAEQFVNADFAKEYKRFTSLYDYNDLSKQITERLSQRSPV